MNFTEYQLLAKRTLAELGSLEKNIQHMKLGIESEVGEIADIFKRKLVYKKEIDITHLKEEIGDLCWYIANAANFKNAVLGKTKYLANEVNSIDDCIDELNFFHYFLHIDRNSLFTINIDELLVPIISVCKFFDISVSEVLEKNINKLKVRYPEKFDETLALNRDLKNERNELEK